MRSRRKWPTKFAAGLLSAAVLVGAAPAPAAATGETAVRNPIKVNDEPMGRQDGTDGPDPHLVHWRGAYYLTYSSQDRVEIRKARTLGELTSVQPTRVWPPAGTVEPAQRRFQLWAPEFHRLRNRDGQMRWFFYYAASNGDFATHRMYVLESERDDPLGPYRFRGELNAGAPGEYAIDGSVYTNDGGTTYFMWAGPTPLAGGASHAAYTSLFIAPMADPTRLSQPGLRFSDPTHPWELVGTPINEGPVALRRGDTLNIVYSASQCNSDSYAYGRISVRADANLMDPATWAGRKHPSPIFQSNPAAGVYSPAHGGFFSSPDGKESWMVYHAHAAPAGLLTGGGCGGARTTRVQPFTFNHDGTPNFGKPVSLGTDIAAPSGDPTLVRQTEDAPVVGSSGDPHRKVSDQPVQANGTLGDSALVGNDGTLFAADASGDHVTYAIEVPRTATFAVLGRLASGPATPIVRLTRVGGPGLGASHDTFAPQLGYREFDFGTATFERGAHRLRFDLTGRNAQSTGFALTVDQLRFEQAFGARTLVTLELAAKRMPAGGPVKVRVTNTNGFEVTGMLSGQTANRKRRIRLRAKAFHVAAHARTTVTLRLPPVLQRLLARKRKLKLRLTAKVKDPARNTRTVKKLITPKLKGKRRR